MPPAADPMHMNLSSHRLADFIFFVIAVPLENLQP